MDFKLFFEAKQEFVNQVKSAVDKVSDRPFNELFAGRERFLVKVYNPKFEKALKQMGYTPYAYDPKKRTINDKPYAKWCNDAKQFYREKVEKRIDEILDDADTYAYMGYYSTTENEYWVINDDHGKVMDDIPFDAKLFKDDLVEHPYVSLGTHPTYKIKNKENVKKYLMGKLNDLNPVDPDIYRLWEHMTRIAALKQTIDQNNIFNYLCFSRHPIDVLRMSDHKGISSCHRLQGAYSDDHGMYAHCAIADAKNDGGVVYLIKGSDGNRIKNHLDEPEVFYDKDRGTGSIQPIGRVRLRRFIDLKTGADFAVPTMLNDETKYGLFTNEIYKIMIDYVREHQSIHKNPPELEYAKDNWVMVGGSYSDEDLGDLFSNFFDNGVDYSGNITHKSKNLTTWQDEINSILQNAPKSEYVTIRTAEASRNAINFTYEVKGKMGFSEYDKRYEDHGHGGWAENLTDIWTFPAGSMATKQIKTENKEWVVFDIRVRTRLFDPTEIQAVINGFPFREKIWRDNNIEPM
jgi:hypothetical protein